MKLAEFGVKLAPQAEIRFTGEPVVTNILTSDGEPYYEWQLVSPITVRCSTDPNILPEEGVDRLYLRESALSLDIWEKDDKGFFIRGWVVDFSKNQQIHIYQETTISEWRKLQRPNRVAKEREAINGGIVARIKARTEQKK